jgi:hypothetical protein
MSTASISSATGNDASDSGRCSYFKLKPLVSYNKTQKKDVYIVMKIEEYLEANSPVMMREMLRSHHHELHLREE